MKPFSSWVVIVSAIVALLSLVGRVQAQTEEAVSPIDAGDSVWILISTDLVLFMTIPALALFYGGLVRSKRWLHPMSS